MRRRGKADGKAIKTQRRKTLRRNAAEAARRTAKEINVAQAIRERDEALEQLTATAEVLNVMSRSAFDLQTVFDALVKSATHLCHASASVIWRPKDDGRYHLAASYGVEPRFEERLKSLSLKPDGHSVVGRSLQSGKTTYVPDLMADPDYAGRDVNDFGGYRGLLCVPLLRDGAVIGVLMVAHLTSSKFSEKQIELVQNFAAQAVIAIENTRLLSEVRESLQQQTATADVLKVISRSTFDLQTVLDTLVESATRLCEAKDAFIFLRKGEFYHVAARYGFSSKFQEYLGQNPRPADRGSITGRTALEAKVVHVPDVMADPEYTWGAAQKLGGYRTVLGVPLLRDGSPVGVIIVGRTVVQPFTEKQIELVTTFADQAVIAIENVRLFDEVQARTRDLSESLQQQTATADVLKVISRSTFDLQPVLDTLTESAAQLCEADIAAIIRQKSDAYYWATSYGLPPDSSEYAKEKVAIEPGRATVAGRVLQEGKTVHVADVLEDRDYGIPSLDAQKIVGHRTTLGVPLMREGSPIGVVLLMRRTPKPFTDRQIELVETFADQAVIAIENVRLFDEVQARTHDLAESLQQQTATADVLKTISRSTFDLQTVLNALIESATRLCNADQGAITREIDGAFFRAASYGYSSELSDFIHNTPVQMDRSSIAGRALVEGRIVQILDVKADPEYTFSPGLDLGEFRTALGVPMLREGVPIGVLALTRREALPFTDKQIELVATFADQAAIAIENVRLFESVEARTRELTKSLEQLRATQDRLVQTQKLASLGQLTAGIAHEMKNPLNFVNNFSAVSSELIDELQETLKNIPFADKARVEINELTDTLRDNLDKVVQHGKRADAIVRSMLLHSRESSGEHRSVDINALVEENLNLAWHGARADKQGFEIMLKQSFDPSAGEADVFPQDITRALLNVISNRFYAATKRRAVISGAGYEPTLAASTKNLGDRVEITIRDNGTGIPPDVKEKMFNPFFTTKPTGEGTGLGLSISYDIIVKQHAGLIEVDTEPGEFTEIRIILPRVAVFLIESPGRP